MLGCTVFHCMERLCLFNQSCTNGDSSFYKFLLSICYVIDNCAEHCGSAVSRVEIFFFCVKYRAWCRASKQDVHRHEMMSQEMLIWSALAAVGQCPRERGRTWFCCLSLSDAPLRRAVINEAVCGLFRLGAEWMTLSMCCPHYIMVQRSRRCSQLSPAEFTMVTHCDPRDSWGLLRSLYSRCPGTCGKMRSNGRRPGALTWQWQL